MDIKFINECLSGKIGETRIFVNNPLFEPTDSFLIEEIKTFVTKTGKDTFSVKVEKFVRNPFADAFDILGNNHGM